MLSSKSVCSKSVSILCSCCPVPKHRCVPGLVVHWWCDSFWVGTLGRFSGMSRKGIWIPPLHVFVLMLTFLLECRSCTHDALRVPWLRFMLVTNDHRGSGKGKDTAFVYLFVMVHLITNWPSIAWQHCTEAQTCARTSIHTRHSQLLGLGCQSKQRERADLITIRNIHRVWFGIKDRVFGSANCVSAGKEAISSFSWDWCFSGDMTDLLIVFLRIARLNFLVKCWYWTVNYWRWIALIVGLRRILVFGNFSTRLSKYDNIPDNTWLQLRDDAHWQCRCDFMMMKISLLCSDLLPDNVTKLLQCLLSWWKQVVGGFLVYASSHPPHMLSLALIIYLSDRYIAASSTWSVCCCRCLWKFIKSIDPVWVG